MARMSEGELRYIKSCHLKDKEGSKQRSATFTQYYDFDSLHALSTMGG